MKIKKIVAAGGMLLAAFAAPAAASAHMRDFGPMSNGVQVVANAHTSCAFANAIFRKTAASVWDYQHVTVTVRSPVTHKRYRIHVGYVTHGRSGWTELVATGPNGMRAALRS
jgi:hypothetical protein